jgi:hypothetical protein
MPHMPVITRINTESLRITLNNNISFIFIDYMLTPYKAGKTFAEINIIFCYDAS